MDVNKVTLIGNLVRDPEVKETKGGNSLATFSVATNRAWRDAESKEKKEAVEYHNVIAWGRLAEIISEYVKKGNKVYVEGRLANRTFEGKDGKKRYYTDVVANNLIMLTRKPAEKEDTPAAMAPEEVNVEEVVVA